MAQAVFHRHSFGYAVTKQSQIIQVNTVLFNQFCRCVDVRARGSAHKLPSPPEEAAPGYTDN